MTYLLLILCITISALAASLTTQGLINGATRTKTTTNFVGIGNARNIPRKNNRDTDPAVSTISISPVVYRHRAADDANLVVGVRGGRRQGQSIEDIGAARTDRRQIV